MLDIVQPVPMAGQKRPTTPDHESSKKQKLVHTASGNQERKSVDDHFQTRIDHSKGITVVQCRNYIDKAFQERACSLHHVRDLGLPVEVWQNVFSYVDPFSLAQVSRVASAFHTILTRSTNQERNDIHSGSARLRSSEDIWRSSRALFFPFLPQPPCGTSEQAIWKLLLGKSCQFCGLAEPASDGTAYNSDLGLLSTRIVWPFAARGCGRCLQQRICDVSRNKRC